ncbi:hypothetical protein Droror1_Dr00004529 [Drosera rotundifolia]
MGLQALPIQSSIHTRNFSSPTQFKNTLLFLKSPAPSRIIYHGDIGARANGFSSFQVLVHGSEGRRRLMRERIGFVVDAQSSSSSSSGNVDLGLWESWVPDGSFADPCLSDIVWPSAGAFLAMAMLGKMDQILASKGLAMTIAPQGAVCAVLFLIPSSPTARKYNMFIAQIGCATIGVLALSIFGPCWLARSVALAASMAFMIYTRSIHPPAASLPLLFIDGAKFHHLKLWYAFFPGATSCILLSIIQELVSYLKKNVRF